MTVMRVLLFVLHVCVLRECEGVWKMAMLGWGWMRCGCGSAGHVGSTRGSGTVSSAADVMRGVGELCEMCMCLARSGVGGEGGEWMRG